MATTKVYDSIVLGVTDIGESDLIVTFLTKDSGKIKCIAKGARKSIKRFMNALEPFTHLNAVVRSNARSDLFFLENASVKDGFEAIRTNYNNFVMASLCVELVDFWCKEGQKEQTIHRLLLWYLGSLASGANHILCTLIFKTRLLDLCGFLPSLYRCSQCTSEITDHIVHYNPVSGQIYCKNCRDTKKLYKMGIVALKSLQFWQRQSEDKIFRLKINSSAAEDAWNYLKAVHCNVLEKQPKTYNLIDKIVY